ncbi:Hypothetical protein NTJ_13815 [Nesidiocoris tenuis]|uniref:Uncharacterized protein n=1 Tax=Nesidiocoris tenuis TaxID=355587 RepID=A0ABN7B9M2_9HEMI|nr:Hypothetical protein NTJ_13815 [Nesidiocoris tenuis]
MSKLLKSMSLNGINNTLISLEKNFADCKESSPAGEKAETYKFRIGEPQVAPTGGGRHVGTISWKNMGRGLKQIRGGGGRNRSAGAKHVQGPRRSLRTFQADVERVHLAIHAR